MKRSGLLTTVAALVAGSVTLALNRTPKTTAAEITLAEVLANVEAATATLPSLLEALLAG